MRKKISKVLTINRKIKIKYSHHGNQKILRLTTLIRLLNINKIRRPHKKSYPNIYLSIVCIDLLHELICFLLLFIENWFV